jgi:Tfp pilus assembly protein PilF
MPISRLGRINRFICFTLLLVACLATNIYLARRITYPPRTLRVRIVFDPSNPPVVGMTKDEMKARVESLSGFFQQAAGIRISVSGFTELKMPSQYFDPEILRRYIDVHMPRENADVLVAFWPPAPGDPRIGSALPYSSIAVVRIDAGGSPQQDQAVLAHQLLTLFGVPISKDPKSVMQVRPTSLHLDPDSAAELMDTRLFDFSRGLAGMSRRMQARILNSLERNARSQPTLASSSTATNTATRPRLVLAELLLRDSQYEAAAEQYRAALRSDANNVNARLGMAYALTLAGRYLEAEAEARAAIKLAPNTADTHYRLGFVLVRSGSPESAIPEFRQAISIQPDSVRNRTALAVAYAATIGEFDAADHEFQEALKLEPHNGLILADIEYVSRLRARLAKQLEASEADARAHPGSGAAHDRLALVMLRLGQIDGSIAEARQALQLGPDTWHPHYTLALALYAKHDYAGSSSALADAKRLGSGERPFLQDALRAAAASPPAK